MEPEIKKSCLNCGLSFTSKRADKKYCSDTCRQMAYFKRNGLSLAGAQPMSNQNNNSVEGFTQKPAVKYNTHPLYLKKEEKASDVKYTSEIPVQDQALEALINRLIDAMEQRFNQRIEKLKQELDVKYSKQPTQSETTQTPIVKPVKLCNPVSFNEQINVLLEKIVPVKYCNPSKGLNVKYNSGESNFMAVEKVMDNREEDKKQPEKSSDHIKPEAENKTVKIVEPNTQDDYQWVTSRFLKHIEDEFMKDDDSYKLAEPSRYWNGDHVLNIHWVNVRLRCLLESLIKLSNYDRIDKHTLLCIQDAFNRLFKSKNYQSLPDNYPYKKLMQELGSKLNDLSIANAHNETLVFRLTPKRKANLIYIRHEMLKHVPAMKFSEINFDEEPSHYYKKAA